MPLGKSGQYYMNPHEMRRKGDIPGAAKPATDPAVDPEQSTDGEQGDGMRHHQIDEMPEGGAHSVRTNADGSKEEMDHESFEDACSSCGGNENDEGQEETEAPSSDLSGSGGDDMAGMYDKAAKG